MDNNDKRKNGTETSSFGISGRANHDSSKFYNRRMYAKNNIAADIPYCENAVLSNNLNKIFCSSSESMQELPNDSVHLMVTSPPYNVGKEYDQDLTLDEYKSLLSKVFKETYRVLVHGGRICINVANLGRKPYIPLHSYIMEEMHKIGYLMRGEVIWDKAGTASPSTAWGSWLSAANPILRDQHEYILVFSKGTYSRPKIRPDSITKEEFLEYTKSVWKFSAESARKIGHPAPFPVELPKRCIKLYTFENDVVLDPFMGSGTTALAAISLKRNFVGYDINPNYVLLANQRIAALSNQTNLKTSTDSEKVGLHEVSHQRN